MTDADRIVAAARRWVGTPWQHQARAFGAGVDCVGLVKMVGIETGFLNPTAEEIAPYARYGRAPNPRRMGEGLRTFLDAAAVPLRAPAPDGFICWIQWRDDLPMHLGIAATFQTRRTIIHAVRDVGKVVEHGLTDLWLSRVAAWFTFPGMES